MIDTTPVSFSNYVSRVCDHGSTSFFQLAEELGLNPATLWRLLARPERLSAQLLAEIADRLDVTVDSLLLRTVDLESLASRAQPGVDLPERYLIGATSRVRTLFPVLRYVTRSCGEPTVRNIFRQLGLRRAVLGDPEKTVSIRLFRDFSDQLRVRGFREEDFFAIGFQVSEVPEYQPVARLLSRCPTTRDLYETAFEKIVPQYERNFRYRILRSRDNEMRIRIDPNPEIQDALRARLIDSIPLVYYRIGLFSGHRRFLGGRPGARILHRANMHDGDAHYEYDLSWQGA